MVAHKVSSPESVSRVMSRIRSSLVLLTQGAALATGGAAAEPDDAGLVRTSAVAEAEAASRSAARPGLRVQLRADAKVISVGANQLEIFDLEPTLLQA